MATRGFTLVELLIVVAIIGVLSVVGLTAYSGVQQKARDTKRKADIDAIAKVMESKYDVKHATYPALTDLATGFASSQLPVPSKQNDYVVSSDGKGFIACTRLDTAPSDLTAQQCIATYNIGTNKQDCYCQKSSSGSIQNIIAAASIGDSSISSITINSTGSGFSTPSNLAVSDTFTKADSTTGLGGTWEYSGTSNSWGILNKQARHMNNGSNNIYAVVDSRLKDGDGIVRVTFSDLVPDQGMVFRYGDSSNTYRLAVNGDGYVLQKIIRGTETTIGQIGIASFDSAYRHTSADITVVLQANKIQVFIDSSKGNSWTMNYTDTDSSLQNNTKAGLWVWADTTMSWDNFSISAFHPVPTPTPTPVPDCTACAADINKDGYVNISDFSLWFSCLNRSTDSRCVNADINRDGSINKSDLTCLLSQFGKQCLNANTAN